MGDFLPCLAHGADKPMISKATRPKLHRFYDLIMKLLHKWKKAKRRDHTTNASDHTSKPFSDDRLKKDEKGVIRVKVVLTKEEAARLLSMCVRGEEKTLTQLMSQLESPNTSGVALGSSHGGWRPVLESIPEDC